MGKKEQVLGATFLLGAVGFALRLWQWNTAFESGGLLIPGQPATWAVMLCSVLALAAALYFSRPLPRRATEGYDAIFAKCTSTVMTFYVAGAFLLGGGGLLYIWSNLSPWLHFSATLSLSFLSVLMPIILLGGLCLACGGALFLLGKNNYRCEGGGKHSGALLIPGITWGVWLVVSYQNWAGNPSLAQYVDEMLAILIVLIAVYCIASFAFEVGSVRLTALFAQLGIYFSMMALASSADLFAILLHTGGICYLTATLCSLFQETSPTPL